MVPTASIIINACIVPLSVIAWLWILLGVSDSGDLAHRGVGSLKYFTVLSNLFSAAASAIYLVVCLRTGELPLWLTTLKLVAASAVMLTFLFTALMLVPRYGVKSLYRGGNLWLHLVLPLLAAMDCCLFVPVSSIPYPMTLWAMVPTAVYGVFYLRTILIHGAEENGVVYDFYGFLRWGKKNLPFVVAAMLLATWLIALVLRFLGGLLSVVS